MDNSRELPLYVQTVFYGSRRITVILNREGYSVNSKAVQRHMQELGLYAIYPGPNLSKRNLQHKIYPYLLRGLVITAPDQVWGPDITDIRLTKGWMYLVAILDWHSRYVVGWALNDTLEADFVIATVAKAFEGAIPEILNSDQGSQFTVVFGPVCMARTLHGLSSTWKVLSIPDTISPTP